MHQYPQRVQSFKTTDLNRAQVLLWEVHELLAHPDLFSTDKLRIYAAEVKAIGDAFAEQVHWNKHGCNIGVYTG